MTEVSRPDLQALPDIAKPSYTDNIPTTAPEPHDLYVQ